jgi:hypothetical protein
MANPQIMAAIAMAESRGNPKAHNVVPPDNSYGLWQVNMFGKLGPARRKQFGITSNEQLYDPVINARAAAKILATEGPGAWSTYTNGDYKNYLGKSSGGTTSADFDWRKFDPWGGLGEVLPDDSLPDLSDATGGLSDIAKLGVKAGEWISNPRSWLNVLYVVLGGSLVLITLSSTVRTQITGQVNKLGMGGIPK